MGRVTARWLWRRDGAVIAVFRKPLSGELAHLERKRFAMHVGSVLNRVGYYPNTDPLVVLHFQVNYTQTITGKCSRCGGRRRLLVVLKPVCLLLRLFQVFDLLFNLISFFNYLKKRLKKNEEKN